MKGLAVLAVAAALAASTASASSTRFPSFRMPSRNIACAYIADRTYGGPMLRCDLLSGLRPTPRARCRYEGSWSAVTMKPRSRAHPICISDTVYDNRSPILAYGRTWRRGGFTCTSRRAGLTCRNLRGHGLFLSRRSWRVF
jgi:hypothetical protein